MFPQTFSWTLTPQAPRRRPTRIGVIAVVAAALVIGIAGYVIARAYHRPPPATAAAPTGAGAQTSVPPGRVDLSGVRWRDFHGIRLPYSRANGPAHVEGDQVRGFADSAGGAVFAAVHIGVRANAQWGPDIYGPTVRDQVDGPDKPALLDQLDSAYEQLADKAGVSSGPVGRAYAVEEGFRVEAFSPDAATVDIVTAGPGRDGTTVRVATRIQLTWCGHDWHVLAPPGGDWGAAAHVLSSAHPVDALDGYRPFGDQQSGGRGGS